jgi:hypothetical protein
MAAMMAAGSMGTVCFAGETEAPVTELSWSDVEGYLDQLGIEGDFVSFDEIAMKMWLPDNLKEVELTDEDKEEGFIGYFESTDDSEEQSAVSVVYVDLDGMDILDYADQLAGMDGVSDIEPGIVNGLPCVSYEMKDQDSGTLAFMTEAGYGLEVTCTPISSDEAQTMVGLILSSIMPDEEAETEA